MLRVPDNIMGWISISCTDPFELYFVEQRGERACSDGSMITDKTECESACNAVGVIAPKNLKDGKPCYRSGQGKCRQNNAFGGSASLICKNRGSQLYTPNLLIQYLWNKTYCRQSIFIWIRSNSAFQFQKSMGFGRNGVNGVPAQRLVEAVIKCALGLATSQFLPMEVPTVRRMTPLDR